MQDMYGLTYMYFRRASGGDGVGDEGFRRRRRYVPVCFPYTVINRGRCDWVFLRFTPEVAFDVFNGG